MEDRPLGVVISFISLFFFWFSLILVDYIWCQSNAFLEGFNVQSSVTMEDCSVVCCADVRQWDISQPLPVALPVVVGLLKLSVGYRRRVQWEITATPVGVGDDLAAFSPVAIVWRCGKKPCVVRLFLVLLWYRRVGLTWSFENSDCILLGRKVVFGFSTSGSPYFTDNSILLQVFSYSGFGQGVGLGSPTISLKLYIINLRNFCHFFDIKTLKKCHLLKVWYVIIKNGVYFHQVFLLYVVKSFRPKIIFDFMNKKCLIKSEKKSF